jgi:hypothetical protein
VRTNSFVDTVIGQSNLVNSPTISIVDPLSFHAFQVISSERLLLIRRVPSFQAFAKYKNIKTMGTFVFS